MKKIVCYFTITIILSTVSGYSLDTTEIILQNGLDSYFGCEDSWISSYYTKSEDMASGVIKSLSNSREDITSGLSKFLVVDNRYRRMNP